MLVLALWNCVCSDCVVAARAAMAGTPFRYKILAKDRFGNQAVLVANYNFTYQYRPQDQNLSLITVRLYL